METNELKESSNISAGTGAELFIYQNILGLTTVTFSITSDGWSKLEKSEAWKAVCKYLEEFQTQDIHWLPQENLIVRGAGYCKNPLSQPDHPIRAYLCRLFLAILNRDKELH